MDYAYAITPFVAWLTAGVIKFSINSVKAKQLAFGLIGYGGLPSNHSAIVSSMAAMIAIKDGLDHPAFGVAIALVFVVVLDANSLRKQVGKQAVVINHLANKEAGDQNYPRLRERIGHSKLEILAGVLVGVGTAVLIDVGLSG